MANDSRPRRKAFGPLFYSTALVAVILLSIYGAVQIREWVGDWIGVRLEAQEIQSLLVSAGSTRGDVRARAYRSLVERRADWRLLIPVLLTGSTDQDDDVRIEAARGLNHAVNDLFHRSDSLPKEREECLQALRRMLKDSSIIVRNEASDGLAAFASALGLAAFDGKDAIVADLRAALADADHDVRIVAAKALLTIEGGRDQAAVGTLLALLADPEPVANRAEVLSVLVGHRQGEHALNALTSLLGSGNPFVLPDVLSCIERLGPEAAVAVPKLESLLDDKDPGVRAGAGMAIVAIEGESTPRVVALSVKAVADQELPMQWRMTAVDTVLGSNPAALSSAAGVLMKQLSNENPTVRQNAVGLLSLFIEQVRPEPPKPDPGR
ncbi:HEAT repeat domain-containing protein [Paludisphaera borealis]|uniref:HEAT repeat domain-containing protein n=1 Tax=Paludisphaera borealis TaxID=1387353 RepID=A0A1U7CJK7_9BACT|nr:HEAT repeat domain-containing protein [Paludisphaera borealis]APW59087.1 hypothetical protein BSF38_00501 [Paludisphaera borealis]